MSLVCFVVPGCNAAWKAQNDFCFLVTSKYSSAENEMKNYCQESGGQLMHATNKSTFRLLEQFLYAIQSSSDSTSTQCIVTGPANASSFSTLPLVQQSVSNSTTNICAIRSSNQWKLQGCNVNSCDDLCIAPRGEKGRYILVIFFSTTYMYAYINNAVAEPGNS